MPGFVQVQLERSVIWVLERDSPPVFPIAHRPGVEFINPLALPSVVDIKGELRAGFFGGPRDRPAAAAVGTNLFCLRVPEMDFESEEPGESMDEYYYGLVPELARRIRWCARNPLSPTRPSGGGGRLYNTDKVSDVALSIPDILSTGYIGGVQRGWVNTQEAIEEAISLPAEWEMPIYGWLMLDAIEAWHAQDWKKAVLLAALSVETAAKSAIELEHARLMGLEPPPERLCVVEQHCSSSGSLERRDPVFKMLTEAAKTSTLKKHLHEISLYVLRRSLLQDDQKLYEAVLGLNAARNEITHKGGREYDLADFFTHFRKVQRHLEAANALHRWLGDPIGYPVSGEPLLLKEAD